MEVFGLKAKETRLNGQRGVYRGLVEGTRDPTVEFSNGSRLPIPEKNLRLARSDVKFRKVGNRRLIFHLFSWQKVVVCALFLFISDHDR